MMLVDDYYKQSSRKSRSFKDRGEFLKVNKMLHVYISALGSHLQFEDYSQSGLVTSDPLDLDRGQSCCIVAMVTEDSKLNVMQVTKGQSDVKLQLSGGKHLFVRWYDLRLCELKEKLPQAFRLGEWKMILET